MSASELTLPPYTSEDVDISSADHTFRLSPTGIYVGTAGDVVAQLAGDETPRTWKAPQGMLIGRFVRVVKAGTTAADMIGVSGVPNSRRGA